MVVVANDIEEVHSKLSILPYYPYMKIEIIQLRMP